jgi:hypothetical protein
MLVGLARRHSTQTLSAAEAVRVAATRGASILKCQGEKKNQNQKDSAFLLSLTNLAICREDRTQLKKAREGLLLSTSPQQSSQQTLRRETTNRAARIPFSNSLLHS